MLNKVVSRSTSLVGLNSSGHGQLRSKTFRGRGQPRPKRFLGRGHSIFCSLYPHPQWIWLKCNVKNGFENIYRKDFRENWRGNNNFFPSVFHYWNMQFFWELPIYRMEPKSHDPKPSSQIPICPYILCRTSSNCDSPEELNLLAACIKLHSVMFCIMPEDIVKCFEIYNFLPGYPVRMKRKDIQLHEMYYTQSRIYTIVCCKEAKAGIYPVLFSYLNFFRNVVSIIFLIVFYFDLHVYGSYVFIYRFKTCWIVGIQWRDWNSYSTFIITLITIFGSSKIWTTVTILYGIVLKLFTRFWITAWKTCTIKNMPIRYWILWTMSTKMLYRLHILLQSFASSRFSAVSMRARLCQPPSLVRRILKLVN